MGMDLSFKGEIPTENLGRCPGCGEDIKIGSKGEAIWLSEIGMKDSKDRPWHKQCVKDTLADYIG